MTSQLNVDTIVDKAGSGGVGIKIGNQATSIYESEGGAVTQNTVQSLPKLWINYKGTATNEVRDSFNVTSVTDSATGRFIIVVGNDFSNDDYAVTSVGAQIQSSVLGGIGLNTNLTSNTSQIGVGSTDSAGNDYDQDNLHFIVCGDLA